MQAVIMAAGEGKRMRPLTETRPKPLIEVAGKPIIVHVLDALPKEITEVVIVVGYKHKMVEEFLGSSYKGLPVTFVRQWMPAGTAHALSVALPFIKGRFLLMNADDIHGPEALAEAVSHPRSILVAESAHPETMGVVQVAADGTLEGIIEKPEKPVGNLVSTGAMVLDKELFEYEALRHISGEYFMTDPLALYAKDHPMTVVRQGLWIPVGTPADIEVAEKRLIEGRA